MLGLTDAETVKFFTKTYLTFCAAYFNELNINWEMRGLNTANVMCGVCLESCISSHYNNPLFGYSGYYLPNNIRQLLANYKDVPRDLSGVIVEPNRAQGLRCRRGAQEGERACLLRHGQVADRRVSSHHEVWGR